MFQAIADRNGKQYKGSFEILAEAMMFITDLLPTQNYKSFANSQIFVTGNVTESITGKVVVAYDGNQFNF